MKRRVRASSWSRRFGLGAAAITRSAARSGTRMLVQLLKPVPAKRRPVSRAVDLVPGVAIGPTGARRFGLYRPPGMAVGDRPPLLVMLHGCGQDAAGFAASTRMNHIARRERFLVLYPEQDRLANLQGCWNWFDTASGRAGAEMALILTAIDQVCLLYQADRARVAIAGFSAGASMAALLAARHPGRFKAVAMHSGIPPGTAHSTLSALGAMRGRRSTKAPRAAGAVSIAWPPLLVIHGAADAVVSPANGLAAARLWAGAAGASAGEARTVQRGRRHPISVTYFRRGAVLVATLAEVSGLAHAWSGGAAGQTLGDVHGPDASSMVWAFAAKQFRATDAALRRG